MSPLQVATMVAIAVAAACGWQARGVMADAKEAKTLRTHVAAVQAIAANNNAIAARYEGTRAALQQRARVTTKEVIRVIETPFYAGGAQCLDADGLQQLRAAIGEPAADAPGAAGPVPDPDQP